HGRVDARGRPRHGARSRREDRRRPAGRHRRRCPRDRGLSRHRCGCEPCGGGRGAGAPPDRGVSRMLELKSIDAGYGSFQALFDVNLDVRAGEAVGVIGPNGAGKTTLMRVISGLIRPVRGSITMQGTDVVATPAHRIVSLGIAHVPENRRLFPRLTVADNLKMGAYMQGARAHYAE
ncbi:hypothetical protein chiPu_0033437, partial [Chiloscyllium punctatum]|nr:hypothetical protein [Chiloscyllium punctatum]